MSQNQDNFSEYDSFTYHTPQSNVMKKLFVVALAMTVFVGCSPKKSNTAEEQEQKVIHDIDKLLEDLTTPNTVANQIKAIGVDFVDSLINPLDNLEKYRGNEDKMALAMGVYSADASYLASNEEGQLATLYVTMCHQIGEMLGDSAIYSNELRQELIESIGEEQKMAMMLKRMIIETSVQLEEDHHLSMAALALTGIFVEEMYHAVNVIENFHEQGKSAQEDKVLVEPLVKLVMAQEQPLLDLIQLLNDIPHDDTILQLLTELDILDRLYKNELATIQAEMDEDPNYVVDRDVMFAVILEFERIRASIVE